MINEPAPPKILTIRQFQCVSCKHIFPISEDRPEPGTNERRPAGQPLRKAPRSGQSSQVRFTAPSPSKHYTHIRCPRCQADNSNWFHISQNQQAGFSLNFLQENPLIVFGLISVLGFSLALAFADPADEPLLKRFLLFMILMSVGTIPFLIISWQWQSLREHIYLFRIVKPHNLWARVPSSFKAAVVFSLILGVVIPILLFIPTASQNLAIRLKDTSAISLVERIDAVTLNRDTLIEQTPENERGAIRQPFESLYRLQYALINQCRAGSVNQARRNLQSMQEGGLSEEAQRLAGEATEQLNTLSGLDLPACNWEAITGVLQTLNKLKLVEGLTPNGDGNVNCDQEIGLNYGDGFRMPAECNQALVNKMIGDLMTTRNSFAASVPGDINDLAGVALSAARNLAQNQPPESNVYQSVERDISSLENQLIALEQVKYEISFFAKWAAYAGAVSLFASIAAVWAASVIVDKMDRHLPRLVFHRVSLMARAVTWDIQSLQLGDVNREIKISRAQRNPDGGITLEGVFCEPGDLTGNGRSLSDPGNQRFIVHTDCWARVIDGVNIDTQLLISGHDLDSSQNDQVQEPETQSWGVSVSRRSNPGDRPFA